MLLKESNVISYQGYRQLKKLSYDDFSKWIETFYKEAFKEGLNKAEEDLQDAEVMSVEKVLEKLKQAGFSSTESTYILEVLLSD